MMNVSHLEFVLILNLLRIKWEANGPGGMNWDFPTAVFHEHEKMTLSLKRNIAKEQTGREVGRLETGVVLR